MSQLPPAYRGAPYRQPPPCPRKQRTIRMIIRIVIAAVALVLISLIGAAVAPEAWPEPSRRSPASPSGNYLKIVPTRVLSGASFAAITTLYRVRGEPSAQP